MQLKKLHTTLGRILLGVGAAAGGLLLLPLLLPFLLGWGAALLAEPGVRRLCDKTPLPRWAASGLCLTALLAVAGTALFFLCKTVCTQLIGLAGDLPALLEGLAGPLDQIKGWLDGLAEAAPEALRAGLEGSVDRLFAGGGVFLEALSRSAGNLAARMGSALPGTLLGTVTAILSAYMISAGLPDLKASLGRRLPKQWRAHAGAALARIKDTLGSWGLAQLKLMGISFGLLTLGLWLLRVDFALLIGLGIALLDALPVLGSGVVLVPWAVVSFLQQDPRMGFGLLLLYAVQALTRAFLEPRILGKQMGLHPLLTLISFYLGYRLMGPLGMLLFPLGAMFVKQGVDLLKPAQPSKDY